MKSLRVGNVISVEPGRLMTVSIVFSVRVCEQPAVDVEIKKDEREWILKSVNRIQARFCSLIGAFLHDWTG
jgi:hypothetical protein